MSGPKIDQSGECFTIDPASGLCRIDGIPVFKIITIQGQMPRLQFLDDDRMRSKYRATRFVEIPIDVLFDKIIKLSS